ncbi:MAG TPA: lipoate--protein ligase family protein [Bacillota bacterium]|nr:lipoate--protein ligase family protein [Bacillota bacterium]
MKNWKDIIQYTQFRYLDHTEQKTFQHRPYTALTSFAIDDALLDRADDRSTASMRLWVHPKTIVLGIVDTRVPYIHEGVNMLADQGYHVIVRNSGGLAVALDEGVLNVSLILPDVKKFSIYDCYEAMVQFVQYMLSDLTNDIEAYEIVGSYCPGDYDLSIHGKKFAGISQRRIKNGAAVQIYLDVEGNTQKRATLIRKFYDVSIKNESTRFNYPTVNPQTMASLSELLGVHLTVDEMKSRVLTTLQHFNEHVIIETNGLSPKQLHAFDRRFKQMIKRNKQIAHMQSIDIESL